MRLELRAIDLLPDSAHQAQCALLEVVRIRQQRQHVIDQRCRQRRLQIDPPRLLVTALRSHRPGLQLAMHALQRPIDHIEICGRGQPGQEGEQLRNGRVPMLLGERLEGPDGLLHVDQHAAGKAVQEIEIVLNLGRE